LNREGNQESIARGNRDSATLEHHAPILLIGYGNPLRADDGISWAVTGEIRARLGALPVKVIECLQLYPEMADQFRDASLVVFVDAAVEGSPGEWRHHRLRSGGYISAFSHSPTPAGLLALAADLYGAAPEAHLFTVCGSSFEYGACFSPEVASALPSVVAEIENLLRTAGRGMPVD